MTTFVWFDFPSLVGSLVNHRLTLCWKIYRKGRWRICYKRKCKEKWNRRHEYPTDTKSNKIFPHLVPWPGSTRWLHLTTWREGKLMAWIRLTTNTHHAFMNGRVYYVCIIYINQCSVCFVLHTRICVLQYLRATCVLYCFFIEYKIFSLNCSLYISSVCFLISIVTEMKWNKHPEMFEWTFFSMSGDTN